MMQNSADAAMVILAADTLVALAKTLGGGCVWLAAGQDYCLCYACRHIEKKVHKKILKNDVITFPCFQIALNW